MDTERRSNLVSARLGCPVSLYQKSLTNEKMFCKYNVLHVCDSRMYCISPSKQYNWVFGFFSLDTFTISTLNIIEELSSLDEKMNCFILSKYMRSIIRFLYFKRERVCVWGIWFVLRPENKPSRQLLVHVISTTVTVNSNTL